MLNMHGTAALSAAKAGTLHNRVRFALDRVREKHASVEAVAAKIGVSRSAVYQLESGETKNLRIENFYALCKLADLRPEWVAAGTGRREPFEPPALVRKIAETGEALPEDAQARVLQFTLFESSKIK